MFVVLSLQIQKTVSRETGNEGGGGGGQFYQQDFPRITTVSWVLLRASEHACSRISSVCFVMSS